MAGVPVYSPLVTDLATVDEVIDFLNPGLPPGEKNKVQLYLSSASIQIGSWLTRRLAFADYVETRNGTGQNRLMLSNFPVFSVASLIFLNPPSTSVPPPISPNNYSWDETTVYMQAGAVAMYSQGYFPKGNQNIVISYSAGFYTPGQAAQTPAVVKPSGCPDLPLDIKLAALELTTLYYRHRDRIGDSGTGLGPERINYFMGAMPQSVERILGQYRNVVPVGGGGPGY